jgi:hypothetical protein
MTIDDHETRFAGLPIVDLAAEDQLKDPANSAWRLSLTYEDAEDGGSMVDRLDDLFDQPEAADVSALVIGAWNFDSSESSKELIEKLVKDAGKLPSLRALFIGDITAEEQEISWIQQSDVTPLLKMFPRLEVLRIRGGEGLELKPTNHQSLRELVIEAGGLPAKVLRGALACQFPRLERLELWTGDDGYGGDSSISDFETLFGGGLFPGLKHLGIRDCKYVDDVVAGLLGAPLLKRLHAVDLSLGLLSDVGGKLIVTAAEAFRHLEKLDLHYHYLSDAMVAELKATGLPLDLSDQQTPDGPDGERYVAVAE